MLVAAVSMGVSGSSFAQEAEEDDEIVVTGSRIVQSANVVSSSPVVTVDEELFDVRGTVDTIDLVNTLPSAYAAQTTAFANGATGTSTLNLRGLGSVRTLVLVDGKRLPPGGPLGGFAADLNLIAPQLVERVEIVTGGASAVYGSDAIAGVANFITRKDFEGVEVDLQYGFNQSNNNSEFWRENLQNAGIEPVTGSVTDNDTFQAAALVGTGLGDGRGNVTGYFNYAKNDGIQQGNRDFSQCATFPIGDSELICLGSNQGPFPTTFVVSNQNDATGVGVPIVDINGNFIGLDDDGNPLTSGVFSLQPDASLNSGFTNAFNFNPFNPIRREVERFNAGFTGYYDVNEDVQAYMDFGFTSSSSPQIIAPSAAFGSSINRVNCDNPVLTDEARALICGNGDINGPFPRDVDGDGYAQANIRRRFVEGGPRTDDRSRTNFRVLGGFRGDISGLNYDVFGQYSETGLSRVQFNQVTFTNLSNALDIVTDPATGLPACRVAVNGTDPSCVPFTSAYDLNVPSSPLLPAYVDTPTLTTGKSTQAVFGGTVGTEVGFKTPWADEGMNALVGFEYRQDTLFQQADGIASSGGLVGSGGATTPANGKTELYEVFAEAILPLATASESGFGASLNGAFRHSDYSSEDVLLNRKGGNFGVNTYAIGLTVDPISDLRIRGQYQRAIRAPNVLELFNPQNSGLASLSDPCSGTNPGANDGPTAAQCANTGLPTSLYGLVPADSGQLNTLTGGNPDLTPEISDTFTLGAIYQPSWASGLTLSVDYFDITLDDAISTIPASNTLNNCLATGDAAFCDLIQRGPDGSLTFFPREQAFITTTSQNVAGFATSGIDFQAMYKTDIGDWGDVSFNYNSTLMLSQESTDVPGTPTYDCTGFFAAGCGSPNHEYRHNFQTSWQTPWDARISAVWRYFSGLDQVGTIDNVLGGTGAVTSVQADGGASIDDSIDATGYIDLAGFYDLSEKITLRAGVNNVLDNDPPIVTTFGVSGVNVEANTVAGVYDAGGRFLFVGANIKY